MELKIVDASEYDRVCKDYTIFYNSVPFHELNKNKVDKLFYFLFKGKKNKLGLVVGVKGQTMRIPYSSPFGMFELLQQNITINDIEESLDLLEQFAMENGYSQIFFRCPPNIYCESFLAKLHNCMLRKQYQIRELDLNYFFDLQKDMENYEDGLFRNAKKNLKHALSNNFLVNRCETEQELRDAYNIIYINRSGKGYPLRMTYEQVRSTINITDYDFFILSCDQQNIAAAIIFRVTEKCYQVIYWGDVPGYEIMRPMNYLPYYLHDYYRNKGVHILDIGPSTEDGIPNYGLCEFKEGVGCSISSKLTFIKELKDE